MTDEQNLKLAAGFFLAAILCGAMGVWVGACL